MTADWVLGSGDERCLFGNTVAAIWSFPGADVTVVTQLSWRVCQLVNEFAHQSIITIIIHHQLVSMCVLKPRDRLLRWSFCARFFYSGVDVSARHDFRFLYSWQGNRRVLIETAVYDIVTWLLFTCITVQSLARERKITRPCSRFDKLFTCVCIMILCWPNHDVEAISNVTKIRAIYYRL